MPFNILVVDDEQPILDLLKANLEPLGANVTATSESPEAARIVETKKFDGVILDVCMPELDGLELTRRVRASRLNRKVPVVILTGMDDVETMRKAYLAGATCFLGKPISQQRIERLFNAMRGPMLCDRRRHARLPFPIAVDCRWGEDRENCFVATCVNLSESGLLLQASETMEPGQELRLKFRLPTSRRRLRPRAKVVRHDVKRRFAVTFTALTTLEAEAIQTFIAGKLKD